MFVCGIKIFQNHTNDAQSVQLLDFEMFGFVMRYRIYFWVMVVFFDLFVMNVITAFIIDAHTALSDDKPFYSVHECVDGRIGDEW